jgi:S1-C subfamily serine protease
MDTAASQSSSQQQTFGFEPTTGQSSHQAYAIPIATALDIAREIVAGDASSTIVIGTPGMLGVEVTDPGTAAGYGSPYGGSPYGGTTGGTTGGATTTSGAEVVGVVRGEPAAAAGITTGDVITGVNGTSVDSAAALSKQLAGTHGGDSASVTWTDTSGSSHTATLTLANGPAV